MARPKPIHGINPDNYLRSADLCEPVARRETAREKEGNRGFPMYAHIYPTQNRRGEEISGYGQKLPLNFYKAKIRLRFPRATRSRYVNGYRRDC